MNYPTEIISYLKAIPHATGIIEETNVVLKIYYEKLDKDDLNNLRSFDLKKFDCSLGVALDRSAPCDSLDDYKDIPSSCAICVHKPDKVGELFFFFSKQAAKWAQKMPEKWENAHHVWLADITSQCDTLNTTIRQWVDNEQMDCASPCLEQVSPTRIVRYREKNLCPDSVSSWLLKDYSNSDQLFLSEFMPLFLDKLSRSLASEIWLEKGTLFFELQGPKRRKIEGGSVNTLENINKLYPVVADATRWVYIDGVEADVKHNLIVAELSREWSDYNWYNGLDNLLFHAFENARTAYNMHVHETSNDALKMMSDLRKSVREDMQSMSTFISKILSSLWRDVAIFVGFLILKNQKLNGSKIFVIIVLFYMMCSAILSTMIFWRSISSVKKYKEKFRWRLYGFLSDDDFNNLYSTPIKPFYNQAYITLFFVVIIYIFLTACFIYQFDLVAWGTTFLKNYLILPNILSKTTP